MIGTRSTYLALLALISVAAPHLASANLIDPWTGFEFGGGYIPIFPAGSTHQPHDDTLVYDADSGRLSYVLTSSSADGFGLNEFTDSGVVFTPFDGLFQYAFSASLSPTGQLLHGGQFSLVGNTEGGIGTRVLAEGDVIAVGPRFSSEDSWTSLAAVVHMTFVDPAIALGDLWGIDIPYLGYVSNPFQSSFLCSPGQYVNCSGYPSTGGILGSVPVPAPSTLILLAIGLFGMGLARRRKKA